MRTNDHYYLKTYKELTSLEGISMRLGTKEETAEESSEEDYDYNED